MKPFSIVESISLGKGFYEFELSSLEDMRHVLTVRS